MKNKGGEWSVKICNIRTWINFLIRLNYYKTKNNIIEINNKENHKNVNDYNTLSDVIKAMREIEEEKKTNSIKSCKSHNEKKKSIIDKNLSKTINYRIMVIEEIKNKPFKTL